MTKKRCPLGEDCDLTTAWMLGRQSEKAEAAARIEELEAENTRLRAAYATPPADLTSPNPWKGEKEC
jgi:hypothetical protein